MQKFMADNNTAGEIGRDDRAENAGSDDGLSSQCQALGLGDGRGVELVNRMAQSVKASGRCCAIIPDGEWRCAVDECDGPFQLRHPSINFFFKRVEHAGFELLVFFRAFAEFRIGPLSKRRSEERRVGKECRL